MQLPELAAKGKTFGDLVDAYAANREAEGRYDAKRAAHLGWWREQLGDYALAEVTPARIVLLRDALASGAGPTGARLAIGTVNRYLATLSHCLSYAERELEWLGSNPARRVKRRSEPRGRVRYLSDTELPRLLNACRAARDPRLAPLVTLALATGARQAELLSLRWSDVDVKRASAVLHHTKNGERRGLALSAPALAALAELRARRAVGAPHVFADPRRPAAPPRFGGLLRRAWDAAVEEAGLGDFRFHDLRHTAASYATMTGATLRELAAFLGHKTLAMVQRYSHLSPEHMKGVADRMADAYLAGATGSA